MTNILNEFDWSERQTIQFFCRIIHNYSLVKQQSNYVLF